VRHPPGVTAEHPDLIDLDTGAWYEWVEEPNGCDHPGYAYVDDHDFTWEREVLEEDGSRIAEVGTLTTEEFGRIRALWDTVELRRQ
jgi:hypothetical protein